MTENSLRDREDDIDMTNKRNKRQFDSSTVGFKNAYRKCIKCEDYILNDRMYSTRELVLVDNRPTVKKMYGCTECFTSRADFYVYIDLNGE